MSQHQEISHLINPLVANGLYRPYHLNEPTLFLGAVGVFFIFITFFR